MDNLRDKMLAVKEQAREMENNLLYKEASSNPSDSIKDFEKEQFRNKIKDL